MSSVFWFIINNFIQVHPQALMMHQDLDDKELTKTINNLIKGFPIIKTMIKDVKTDKPVLNVKYLNTFKKPKISTKFNKN